MASILDRVKLSEPVESPETERDASTREERHTSTIDDARDAVLDFLKKTLDDVRRVSVQKLVQIDPEKGTWEAEADVYVPNATIKGLRLPVQREVLDCQVYLLRLDGVNITAYALKDSVETPGREAWEALKA